MRLIDADLLGLTDMEIIMCNGDYKEALKMLIDKIEHAPAIELEPQWIPVGEKLPKDCTEVLVYLFDRPSPYIAWIEDTHWCTEDFEVDKEDEPIAWMPLPSPYQEEGEQK